MNKSKLRYKYLCKRSLLSKLIQQNLSNNALQILPTLLSRDQWLCLYWPLSGEADLRALAKKLPVQVALPAVRNHKLSIHEWHPGCPLFPDDCGLPSPLGQPELESNKVGIILAPGIAFDNRGIRLGYGGGYYDRLRSNPGWRSITAIVVASELYRVKKISTDPWDIPFNGCLTEVGLSFF